MTKPNHPADKQFINPDCHWKYVGAFRITLLPEAVKTVEAMLPSSMRIVHSTLSIPDGKIESERSGVMVIIGSRSFNIKYVQIKEIRCRLNLLLWIHPQT